MLELLKRVGKKEYQHITRSMWLLLISIASLNTIVCYTIVVDWLTSESTSLQTSDFLALIAFVLINITVFLFYERFSDLQQRVKEQSLLEQQLSLQKVHYRDLEAYQQQISSLHHEMRNYIGVAANLVKSGNTNGELADYLESVNEKWEDIEQTISTGNPSIDSVLNLKLSQLKYTGIPWEERGGEMIPQGVDTVYYDQNGYYQLSELHGGVFQSKMSDQAALYLMEFAGLELNGTEKFSDGEMNRSAADKGVSDMMAGHFTTFSDLTYEGILAASAENLIEIQRDGAVIQSISDNQEVYDLLVSLNISAWSYVETIPDTAIELCTIVRYQSGRREFAGQMMEQSRFRLSRNGTDYYMDLLVADNGSGLGDWFNALFPQRFLVPSEIGESFYSNIVTNESESGLKD